MYVHVILCSIPSSTDCWYSTGLFRGSLQKGQDLRSSLNYSRHLTINNLSELLTLKTLLYAFFCVYKLRTHPHSLLRVFISKLYAVRS